MHRPEVVRFDSEPPRFLRVMTKPDAGDWYVLPPVVLRSAGLPVSLLDGLVVTEIRQPLADLELVHRRLAQLRRRHLPELVTAIRLAGSGGARPLRRFKELVLAGRPIPDALATPALNSLIGEWNALLARWDRLLEGCLGLAAKSEAASTGALASLVDDESVAESIFINSPSALGAIEEAGLSLESHPRRTLVAYLQRFASKVETASFFGPVNFLEVDGDAGGGLVLDRSEPGWKAQRRVSISYWAAQTMALALRSNGCPESHLRLYRRAAPADEDGPRQDDVEAAILAAADGTLSIRGLALRLRLTAQEIVGRGRGLEARGMLRIGLRIPSSAAEPLRCLMEMMEDEDLEAGSRDLLQHFDRWRAAFQQASFDGRRRLLAEGEETFAGRTTSAARRGQGAFYSDRFIYIEEAFGNLPGRVGAGFLARLAGRLGTALDLLASEAVEARLADDTEVLRTIGPAGGPAWSLARQPYRAPAVRLAQVRAERWRRLIPDPSAPVVRLDRAGLSAAGMIRDDLDRWPLFCSPDLMLGGTEAEIAAGNPRYIVLSEAHHIITLLTLLTRQFQDRSGAPYEDVLRSLHQALGSPNLMVPAFDRLTKAVDYTSAGMYLLCLDEVRGEPDATPVPVAELTVEFAGGRSRLRRGDRVYALLPDYGDFPPDPGMLRSLALPGIDKQAFSLGPHTPRVEIEEVIYQRERWDLQHQDLDFASGRPRSSEVLRRVWQFKARQGIPDRVFVRATGEDKPFYVDFASPDLCLLLASHARGASAIAVTEALPRPEDSWLKTSAGRHCSELRLTVVRRSPR